MFTIYSGHYLDQRRLKQGLYRHPWDDISYILPEYHWCGRLTSLAAAVYQSLRWRLINGDVYSVILLIGIKLSISYLQWDYKKALVLFTFSSFSWWMNMYWGRGGGKDEYVWINQLKCHSLWPDTLASWEIFYHQYLFKYPAVIWFSVIFSYKCLFLV